MLVANEAARWGLLWAALARVATWVIQQVAPTTEDLYGRLALEGSNTIALGRVAGAAMVAVGILWLGGQLRWFVAAPYSRPVRRPAFRHGSRGPLLAIGIVALVCAVAYPRRRLRNIAFAAVFTVARRMVWQ